MATEREIAELKQKVLAERDKLIQAKGTYVEIIKNINNSLSEGELIAPGITEYYQTLMSKNVPANEVRNLLSEFYDSRIAEKEKYKDESYEETLKKYQKWYKK